jgi:hypothetical protein
MVEKWEIFERYLKCEPGVMAADVVTEYKETYQKAALKENVQPIIDRLEQAKTDYFNALFDLYDREHEYRPIYDKVRELDGGLWSTNVKPIFDFSQVNLITTEEIDVAVNSFTWGSAQFPKNIKRIKN